MRIVCDALRAVWPRYRESAIVAAAVVVIGILLGFIWARSHSESAAQLGYWLELVGAILVLWSILAQLGFEKPTLKRNQSWTEDTDVERLDRRLFRVLNVSGIWFLAVGASAARFAAAH